jgi:hypothetical protein
LDSNKELKNTEKIESMISENVASIIFQIEENITNRQEVIIFKDLTTIENIAHKIKI